jgi:hypothetical protein
MRNMLPGNSFPQICVVSVQECLVIGRTVQEYGRIMDFSNVLNCSKVT